MSKKRQSGITLIEILVSLSIMAAMTAGVARLIDQYSEDTKSAITAQHMAAVGNAAQNYIKDNYATVMGVATPTTPAYISVPMLIATGYLSAGYSAANNYGQSTCVLVLEPFANMLDALVISEGGTVIDDISLGGIAGLIGAAGGGIYSDAPTLMRGSMGGWGGGIGSFANANASNLRCDGSAGTPVISTGHPLMALWFANGDISSGFLNRNAVPGRPDLNTMNTPLIMGSVQTKGAACGTVGAIARDATGLVMSCQGGVWKEQGSAFWKDPVNTFAALPAGDPVGTVRMTMDTGRGFMWTGGAWNAIAVDQAGNLNVPGTLTGGAVNSSGNMWAAGTITGGAVNSSSSIYAPGTITGGAVNSNSSMYAASGMSTSGSMYASGNIDAAGMLSGGWAVETYGCTTGQIGKAAYTIKDGWAYNGKMLSCVNGAWKNAVDADPAGIMRPGYCETHGIINVGQLATVGPTCGAFTPYSIIWLCLDGSMAKSDGHVGGTCSG